MTENKNKFGKVPNLKFRCSLSPYFDQKRGIMDCPFNLYYVYDDDEEEYSLDCYDEMHNHMLCSEPSIIPFQKKTVLKPTFPTVAFFKFEELKA